MNDNPAAIASTHPVRFVKVNEEVHIASFVVQCLPEQRKSNIEHYQSKPECTVYSDDKPGTFVLVLETTIENKINRFLDELNNQKGVIGASLVYHHCESEHSLAEEMSS